MSNELRFSQRRLQVRLLADVQFAVLAIRCQEMIARVQRKRLLWVPAS